MHNVRREREREEGGMQRGNMRKNENEGVREGVRQAALLLLDNDFELTEVLGSHSPDGRETLGDGREGLDDDGAEQVDRDLPPRLSKVELLEEQAPCKATENPKSLALVGEGREGGRRKRNGISKSRNRLRGERENAQR